MFSYIIDNSEKYAEDYCEVELLSLEKISFVEFKNIVKDAFEECKIEGFCSYSSVADKIMEKDKRFFLPQRQAVASISWRGELTDMFEMGEE